MDYLTKFSNRIEQFMYAVNTYPHCMENEFVAAVNELDIHDNEVVVNLAAGGLHLHKYLPKNITYFPFDFSKEWCYFDKNIIYTPYDNIPLENESVDKIIILAVLHHFTDEERATLYKECHRILKKSGKMVIADVIKNSPQDGWLNHIVNTYNPLGHHGRFFDLEDATLIKSQHFDVQLKNKKYDWWFNHQSEMLAYLKHLFYLTISDDELINHIHMVLKLCIKENKYHIEWELLYFICQPLDP